MSNSTRVTGSSVRIRSTSSRRPNRRIVVWKGSGVPSGRSAIASPSTITSRAAEGARGLDQLGHRGGHLVEPAGVDPHLVVQSVDLDPRAVELVFHRRLAQLAQRLGHVVRAAGEHRQHRPEEPDGELGEAALRSAERGPRHGAEISRHHEGASHLGRGSARGAGDGFHQQALERALAKLADDQAGEESLLVRGEPREQSLQRAPLGVGGSLPAGARDLGRASRPPPRAPPWAFRPLPRIARSGAWPSRGRACPAAPRPTGTRPRSRSRRRGRRPAGRRAARSCRAARASPRRGVTSRPPGRISPAPDSGVVGHGTEQYRVALPISHSHRALQALSARPRRMRRRERKRALGR